MNGKKLELGAAFAPKDTAADFSPRLEAIQRALEVKAEQADRLTDPEKQIMSAAVEIFNGLSEAQNQAGMIGLLERALNINQRVLRSQRG